MTKFRLRLRPSDKVLVDAFHTVQKRKIGVYQIAHSIDCSTSFLYAGWYRLFREGALPRSTPFYSLSEDHKTYDDDEGDGIERHAECPLLKRLYLYHPERIPK